MNWKVAAVVVLGCCLPLMAATPKQSVSVTTTDRVAVGAGGIVHLNGSIGQLAIEGWDQPAVEITVTRTLFFQDTAQARAQAKRQLDAISVSTEHKGTNELVIATKFPKSGFPKPLLGKTAAQLVYRVMVPRDSKLLIQHDGDITIHGVSNDIDVRASGGIYVLTPGLGSYSIDARSRLGEIYADFSGKYQRSWYVLGEKFSADAAASAHKLYLRAGVGEIDIQKAGY